jgi:hypothetical protein
MSDTGLAAIFLDQALRQSGCPICRCCLDGEAQYLEFMILECINDGATHARLAQSLGLCQRHALQAAEIEQRELGTLLGNSIIYETLLKLVVAKLGAVRTQLDLQDRPSKLRSTLWHWLEIPLPGRSSNPSEPLAPQAGCRVCETASYISEHYARVLVSMLARDNYRALYAGSDGVCLAHLRAMVQTVEQGPGLEYVLAATETRLRTLSTALEAIADRQGANQDLEAEEASIKRAIAFLTGSGYSGSVSATCGISASDVALSS